MLAILWNSDDYRASSVLNCWWTKRDSCKFGWNIHYFWTNLVSMSATNLILLAQKLTKSLLVQMCTVQYIATNCECKGFGNSEWIPANWGLLWTCILNWLICWLKDWNDFIIQMLHFLYLWASYCWSRPLVRPKRLHTERHDCLQELAHYANYFSQVLGQTYKWNI